MVNPTQLRKLPLTTLMGIAQKVGIDDEVPESLRLGQRTVVHLASDVDRYVLAIWKQLATMARVETD